VKRQELESAAFEYFNLRGLFGVPIGALFVLAALGNWRWGPLRHAWVFLLCVATIGVASLLIHRFYNENYGRVTLSRRQQVRTTIVTGVFAPLMVVGWFLLRSRVGWSLDLPVNPMAASFALTMLLYYAATIRLRAHHILIYGALLVAGLLPVWRGDDPSNIGLVLAGVAVATAGLLDHRLLVRNVVAARHSILESRDVGA
jgi:hypothetical protein